MCMAGRLPLREGMSVMLRPNIEGTRYLIGPGPGEPHGLYSACPLPQPPFQALHPTPPAWASSQETGIPSPGPSLLGDMSQQVQAQQEAGWRGAGRV